MSHRDATAVPRVIPLAEELRPRTLDDLVAITDELRLELARWLARPVPLLLVGPPGCGKTTLAGVLGRELGREVEHLSGVTSGVKELREVAERSRGGEQRLLFVDEVHRFSRTQQDALLPHLEEGAVLFIGATTEHPTFALAPALLSRLRIINLTPFSEDAIRRIALRAADQIGVVLDPVVLDRIVHHAGGDARRAVQLVEGLAPIRALPPDQQIAAIERDPRNRYARGGDIRFDLVSAFIKSLRGSDPSAALYWGLRIIEGGEDPRFVFRRLMIFAAEDVGNADPRALTVAVSAAEAFDRSGLPEGKIPLAQCITYLATAPKSNRSYTALHEAEALLRRFPNAEVPRHLRNAPTKLHASAGNGEGYRYPHDDPNGFVRGERYLPPEMLGEELYRPSPHGYELTIGQRLARWRGDG